MKKISKKIITFLLVFTLAFGLMGITTFAADGAEKITTVEQLAAMSDGDYILGANIEIDAVNWTPVSQFTGTFDGNSGNYSITWKGTASGTTSNFAIIANNSGTVENLNVNGSLNVSGSNQDYFSAVVGTNQAGGVVNNVTSSVILTASGQYNVGGIVGINRSGYILNCANTANVSGYSKVGGIVGTNFGTVNSCSNSAEVYASYNSKGGVGGIAGHNGDKNDVSVIGNIWNCWNGGKVYSNDGSWMGGICGFLNSGSKCVNCFNYGVIEGHANLGNISGKTEGIDFNCYGSQDIISDPESVTHKSKSKMQESGFVSELNIGAQARWTQTTGCLPTLTKTATTSDVDPSAIIFRCSGDYKKNYIPEECFDPTNLTITATYNDGTVETVSGPYTFTPSTTTPLTTADTYVSVSGTYKGLSFEVKAPITVKAIGLEIVMESAPTKTNYTAGERFDTTGMLIVARRPGEADIPITDYNLSIDGALTSTDIVERIYGTYGDMEYSFDINIQVERTQSVSLGGSGQFTDFVRALDAVNSGGNITVMGTVQLTEPITRNDNVTISSNGLSGSPMFNVNTEGIVTLTTMTFNGAGGTIFQVQNGTLRLRGNVELTNCSIGVDVLSGGALTVNKAQITAQSYSIKAADSSSTVTLEDFGGTSISGNVYLGTGAVVTAKAAIPCNLTFDMAAHEENTAIIVGNGYDLQDSDAEQVTCLQGDVELDSGNNRIILIAEYLD